MSAKCYEKTISTTPDHNKVSQTCLFCGKVTGKGTQHVPANKIQHQVHSLYIETELFMNTS